MLKVTLNKSDGIALIEPGGMLTEADFIIAASVIDPYIEESGKLHGIIIHAEFFPGWQSFAALLQHLRFVADHHTKIDRVAFVTDSPLGEFNEHFASHFVSAEVKHFSFTEMDDAKNWILS